MDNNKDFGTLEKLCEDILNDMDTYDSILLGFGTELLKYKNDEIDDVLSCLAKYLEHKNYFIISSVKDDILRNSELNQKRIVCPYLGETDKTNEDKQWDLYNKWLSGTLAKKLLVVELGEGFNNPNLIKWPFERIVMINEKNLENYPNQPFSLYEGDKKKEMIESIKLNGIMQPLIVRPLSNGKYQILAGHNRRMCAKEIGINELPCIIKNNLSEDEAKIYLIDTNLCTRDNISPIEKAKAYRIKYDTYKKRKIQTSVIEEIKRDNNGLRAELAREEKTSNGTIQRYLRLTYLIPELQELIEQGKLSINLGEKISFIPNEEQKILNEMILNKEIKLNEKLIRKIRNTLAIKKLDKPGQHLSKEEIIDVIEDKSKIKLDIIENITITFSKEEVIRYFKDYKDESEIKAYIVKKLENT